MRKMQEITLTNDFHGTSRVVRALEGDVLSMRRIRDIERSLCGIQDCTCGDVLGRRGPQESSELDFVGCDYVDVEYGELLVVAF